MTNHLDFTTRLRQRIAAVQGTTPDKISISTAAKEIDIPETTLRSTLEGRYPRTESYWRKLRTYTQTTLDWLICALGDPPEDDPTRPAKDNILVVENDLDRLYLIKEALKDYRLDMARSPDEAILLMKQWSYDLVLGGETLADTPEAIRLLVKLRNRPRLVLVSGEPLEETDPFRKIADSMMSWPLVPSDIAIAVESQLIRR